jgi:CRP-like cAMP-binding protein
MTGEPAAFMSYARFDDLHDDGKLTAFRERLAAEVRAQTGQKFAIFQDRADIAWGENWQQRIVQALDNATLLLVIITPGFFHSPHCRAEVQQFLDRERQLGRDDLILPVYYIKTPEIDDPGRRADDPLAAALAARQYADWRELRFEPTTSPDAHKAIAQLAARMCDTFWRPAATIPPPPGPWVMPGAQAPRTASQASPGPSRQAQGLDQAAEVRTEQLRQQLAEAEARADRAVREAEARGREADELRQQLGDVRKPEIPDVSAAPFWDVLDPTEREMLRSVASMRTFAKEAAIMQQGEPADHVIVILAGKASIRVNENGRERELAKRSRGQLIGERAALEVSIRSATVIALEQIWALVVQTKDFATFISANPRVLAFVQNQRHARGTDDPDGYDHHPRNPTGSRAAPVNGMAAGQPNGVPAGHQRSLNGENCTVILTDVVAFGARKRTDTDRSIIRETLYNMMKAGMQGFSGARLEDRGDGILIVIPPDVPTTKAIDQLLRVLPRALDQHNSSQHNPAQFQLRLSVSVGPVASDAMGVTGEAIIAAARMVEAPAFKEAFTGSTVRLGVIVSPFVYDTVIRHDQDQDYVASYSPVPVEVKESRTTAWMMLIG